MNQNTIVTVQDKMIFGGACLAKIDGKTIFVYGALPGETVEIAITEEKKDYAKASVTKIINPSDKRIEPRCPYYGICGGCNLQIANISYQRELKKQMFNESLCRAGLAEAEIPEISVLDGKEWGYRNRFQLHQGGLKAKNSNEIIPIKDCPVAVNEIRSFLAQNNSLTNEKRTHIFGYNDKVFVAKQAENRGKFAGTICSDENICTVNLKNQNISFDVRGFFQSNISMLEKTIEKLTYNLGGKRCADIYSGVGTFSTFLTNKFSEVYLVEHNRDAIVMAEKNLKGTNHKSYGVSGKKWAELNDSKIDFDAVVIDPPRSGMEKEVRQWLKKCGAPQIRALSCDAVTFARDAKDLVNSGYKMESLMILDYYPQTHHMETLAYFAKNTD